MSAVMDDLASDVLEAPRRKLSPLDALRQAMADAVETEEAREEELTELLEVSQELQEPEESPLVQPLTEEETHALRLRVVEALLFAAAHPLDVETIEKHLNRGVIGEGADVLALLDELKNSYRTRGIELVESSRRFSLRTAPDLADYLRHETVKPVKLSRTVGETLAIIAYHQPVTRAEIEAIRGVATSRGTLDYLMQLGWVRPGRRRETPGRPLTWVTTPDFLDHFGLGSLKDLPGMDELKAAGLLDAPESMIYGVLSPDMGDDLPASPEGEPDELPDFIPAEDSIEQEKE